MKTFIYTALLAIMSCTYSCAPSGYLASEYGDEAEITMKMNRSMKAELLTVTDTMIYVLNKNNILGISNKNLKEVKFKKYADDYSWVIGVSLYEVLPSLIISTLALNMDAEFGATFAITIIPAVVSSALFVVSSAKSSYDNFKYASDVFELKKFSRYPGGITDTQMENLLKFYGQDSCIYLIQK